MDIVSRSEWGFSGKLGPAQMKLPARGAWLHHSVTVPTRSPHADMRTLERIGIERFGRLSYSYAIHPSGVVLEGQGDWIGAHTKGQNSTTFGIVLIGNYHVGGPVPIPMVESLTALIRELRGDGRLAGPLMAGYLLGGHRDAPGASTSCPGDRAHVLIGDVNTKASKQPPTPTQEQEADPLPHISEENQKWLEEFVERAKKLSPGAKPSSLWHLLSLYRSNRNHFEQTHE